MPGGVSSPVRSFRAVGGDPPFIVSGKGSRIRDADGRTYVDLVGSWGPLILGHARDEVVEAIREAAARGTSFGATTEAEVELAEIIASALDSVEMARFVSSGTEATMSAVRLARAATGRKKILKFAGCYHGHVDALLVSAGSGAATIGVPDSPGVTEASRSDTVVAKFNSVSSVDEAFDRFGTEFAAVIVEPIAANMGIVPPAPGFLESLRRNCDIAGSLLIFDEVVTGFRVGWGGAQAMFGVTPDLTTLGKVIGGGLPIGAYGGRIDLMEQVAPAGPVYQAGTLSGNPLSTAAGIATLKILREPGPYERLETLGRLLQERIERAAKEKERSLKVQRVGSMLTPYFADREVNDFDGARASDTSAYAEFFHGLLGDGIYSPPSQFEAWFLSLAHDEHDVELIAEAVSKSLKRGPA
jgi:glutamate-1-semialdehyde 2,1-aminomutase